MNRPPREPQDLAELAGLPPDDPRLAALDTPTRARLRAYLEFMAAGASAGARVPEAEARLGAALDRELGLSGEPGTTRAPAATRTGGGFWRALLAPPARLAWGAAALAVVAGGLWMGLAPRRAGEPVLRGADSVAAGAVAGTRALALPDGTLRLEWSAAPEADAYTVVFSSPDLVEIARVEGLTATRLDLRRGALPAGLPPGGRVLWQVTATRGPDALARSTTGSLTLP